VKAIGLAAFLVLLLMFVLIVGRSNSAKSEQPFGGTHATVVAPPSKTELLPTSANGELAVRRLSALVKDFENGKDCEVELAGCLIELHGGLLCIETRAVLLEKLEALVGQATPLSDMLVASLLGGLSGAKAAELRARLLVSTSARVVAWAAHVLTMLELDESTPRFFDKNERMRAYLAREPAAGFNLKDYEFFWLRTIWDICSQFHSSMKCAHDFLARFRRGQPASTFSLVPEDLALYSSAYEHELKDAATRSVLLGTLGKTRDPEDRVAVYKVLSYRLNGEPWPDIVDFCRAATTDVDEDPLIRYSAIGRLAIGATSDLTPLFRDAFLMEVKRSGGHLGVARSALSAMVRADSQIFSTDPTLSLVLTEYAGRLAKDVEYRDQLSAVLDDMRPFVTDRLRFALHHLADEMTRTDASSGEYLRAALRVLDQK